MNIFETLWYYLEDYWIEVEDQRVKEWTFIKGGLWKILLLVSCYLLITLKVLPRFMKYRKPYDLKNVILLYNIFMVVANVYGVAVSIYLIDYGRIFFDFHYPSVTDKSPETMYILSIGWIFMLTRLIDLADTVFFVLRKKERQISFLHVYHHSVVPVLFWVGFKYNITIPFLRLFALLNTTIHTLMYGYYALSSCGPRFQKYLFWKKYLTTLQIIQFVILGSHCTLLYFKQVNYPMPWLYFNFAQQPLFFAMFANFYIQAYRDKRKHN